ncbi:MAG TPA: arabinofuranosidase catalytic domain-containing protein [Terracidiphilus sp.]|nr:arabinofuranosidase catalytic domain-containing protein [Terracidiphilus sp.]
MKTRFALALILPIVLALTCATMADAQVGSAAPASSSRPEGPCDIYSAAGDPCVAAHSTTRALYAAYNGPLYQILRQSDLKTLDIGIVQSAASDPGGYADAGAQDKFCANTHCWITKIYDQSPKHNDLTQAPRGGFSGPAMGGFNNLPIADMAPITVMGHKAYGVFIAPGMGLRQNDAKGTAVDDQAEGQYWVINGLHFNNGCCFDYGNAEIDSRDDDNGTMETAYYGNATPWFHGSGSGPWIMTDQENNLVGCVNTDNTKGCPNLPTINWRFVTAIAKGEPHHWTSMGGDAQKGPLSVMFSGARVDPTYDPMRKQGAILLGNGGDNSNASQGTFYEGAMTAANTFPTDQTDQAVQSNIVAAHYDLPALTLTPASAAARPPGLQTFSPGSSQDVTLTFTNTTGAPASGVRLSLSAPSQWTAIIQGTPAKSKVFTGPIAPGANVSASFKVTSGSTAFNGDLIGSASWRSEPSGTALSETVAQKVRNASPVKINEFRIGSSSANTTDSFIELYNAGTREVDISSWTLTAHPSQQPIFSTIKIPASTHLRSHGFYLLGLANSGLAVPARPGETTIFVRSATGMNVGDSLSIDSGSGVETHKIATVGTPASAPTTLWQPVPDGPVITIPVGSTNVPVSSTSGFAVGQKIAIGYGATYPAVAKSQEHYEVATVTAVGKSGTQAFLALDAPAGATNIQVTSVDNISVGDKIRLDIDSIGHGIETVTVTKVGTQSKRTNLAANAPAASTNIKVRNTSGLAVGDKVIIGTPANHQTVSITTVGTAGPHGTGVDFTPALEKEHANAEVIVNPGTGLDISAPLRFNHAANLPFSDNGTGISFQPATAFPHSSNEPVLALGVGITLDSALTKDHAIDAVVRDASVKTAGYQGTAQPSQWFGGPALSSVSASSFGPRAPILNIGSMVLRDATGIVVDSLNYGGLTDPWASEGYQGVSGTGQEGCFAPSPASTGIFGPTAPIVNRSSGRYPDGSDSDSNCTDFLVQPATTLAANSDPGGTNIKVAGVEGFEPGQKIMIDAGANLDTAVVVAVGTAGGTTASTATPEGATTISVAGANGFRDGETITIDSGANTETAVVANVRRFGGIVINVTEPLAHAHAAGAQISGTGITLKSPLTRAHASGAQIASQLPTPGAPNDYYKKQP